MNDFLFNYERVYPTTWVYLSSLLMVGLFFKFSRLWSVRNLDLLLLISLSPGLLLVFFGQEMQHANSPWAMAEQREAQQALALEEEEPPQASPTRSEPVPVEDPPPEEEPQILPPGAIPESDVPESPVDPPPVTDDPQQPTPEVDPASDEPDVSDSEETTTTTDEALSANPSEALIRRGQQAERLGFALLLIAGGLLMVRALTDPTMVRRPRLEPNLAVGGLAFIGIAMLFFVIMSIATGRPVADDLKINQSIGTLVSDEDLRHDPQSLGPGYPPLRALPSIPTQTLSQSTCDHEATLSAPVMRVNTAKTFSILSQLAIVMGMVFIGYRHFGNTHMGIGAATIYLIQPYTVQMGGNVDHALPAALLVWAIAAYRRPLLAGILLGLAGGVMYYPMFLLPLWISFYWERGLFRMLGGMAGGLGAMVLSLFLIDSPGLSNWQELRQMFGLWYPVTEQLKGIWNPEAGGLEPAWRIPVLATFVILSLTFAFWPAQKNLGTLLSCSAAVMIATQFWHGHGGGTYMAWYLPLMVLTIFRPNLEDRVALTVLGRGWLRKKKSRKATSQST